MIQKSKIPSLVSILVLTVLTSVMWISLSVYRALTSKPAPVVTQNISQPLVPSLDTDTITKVESRLFLDASQVPQIVVSQTTTTQNTTPTPSPTHIATPTPEATASAQPTATP